ncbi:Transposon BEL-like protein [Operophtera brumata]|uniref:Transposon BEL-like protein n=1 Tax=Operophtera brumata TaxID=104452 RepID=A0A0L7LU11_OPEBR|nr:Transposon BEL-like protein [Operophtera brumata]
MEALLIEFDELQSRIEVLNEPNQDTELATRDLVENEFDTCISIAQDFIKTHSSPSQQEEVLIKEVNVPPLCWRLGRVSRLYIGSDQIPRVADIATANGTIKRALNRLVLLPTSDSNES